MAEPTPDYTQLKGRLDVEARNDWELQLLYGLCKTFAELAAVVDNEGADERDQQELYAYWSFLVKAATRH